MGAKHVAQQLEKNNEDKYEHKKKQRQRNKQKGLEMYEAAKKRAKQRKLHRPPVSRLRLVPDIVKVQLKKEEAEAEFLRLIIEHSLASHPDILP